MALKRHVVWLSFSLHLRARELGTEEREQCWAGSYFAWLAKRAGASSL